MLGVQVTLLASNAATQSYEITLQQGAQGMGPPPHKHDWDESFFVLTGTIEFSCAGKAQAGCRPARWCMYPRVPCTRFALAMAAEVCLRSAALAVPRPGCSLKSTGKYLPGRPDISKVIDILQRYGVTVAAGPSAGHCR